MEFGNFTVHGGTPGVALLSFDDLGVVSVVGVCVESVDVGFEG